MVIKGFARASKQAVEVRMPVARASEGLRCDSAATSTLSLATVGKRWHWNASTNYRT